jgi:Fe-S cluster biogenesis protein NfuA
MSSRATAETIINRVRPFIQADGGDVELVEVRGREVHVRLTGACADCPQAQITLHLGIESALRRQLPDVSVVRLD